MEDGTSGVLGVPVTIVQEIMRDLDSAIILHRLREELIALVME